MFGLKWPWITRREERERQEAARRAQEEREHDIAAMRERTRAFVAEQQKLAAIERGKRAQTDEARLRAQRSQVVEDMRLMRAQTHSSPRPPARQVTPQPVTTRTDTGTRVLWDEPMHLHVVQPEREVVVIPAGSFQPGPDTELRPVGGGGSFDGGGASGDWSGSSDSSDSSSGGDSGCGGGGTD